MFSSKFLSGANPLNAVSSAVNKFSLFGDDGEGEKKPPGEQQQGAGPGKDPKQQQGQQKLGQAPPMQKNQPAPKQGSAQLQGNGQTGPSSKSAGPQATPKAGTQPEGQLKGEPPKNQPKGPGQQGSPKPGAQQQNVMKSGPQQGSPKAPSHQVSPNTRPQQGPANTGAQQKEPAKTGVQGSTRVGPEPTKQQQGSPKAGQQQQKGAGPPPKQQASDQRRPVQQGSKGPGTSGTSPAVSSSPGTTKARAQSKSLCPVCKTTELNLHTKEPPNHKTCTQCKTEVCSLCGFSPPDSDGREWLCLTCQIQRAQGTSEAPRPPMNKPSPNKTPASQNQTPSPAGPVKKEIDGPSSSQNMQPTSGKAPAKENVAKGQESKKQGSPAPVQKMTPETQRTSQKPNQAAEVGRKQSGATPAPQQESGGFFGFGGAKTEAAKPEESVTGKMFGFGSSIFSSASTLISSAVQDEPKTTPPVSPKIQSTKENKPSPKLSKPEQEKKQEQSQQTKVQPASPGKMEKPPPTGKSSCPICQMGLNTGSKDPPNYSTCTDCKSTVCNQCGFNPMPNVKEGKEWLCLNCQVKRAAGSAELQRDTPPVTSLKKPTPTQPAPQKTSAPGSPQKKESTPATPPAKAEATDSQKKGAPAPAQTVPQGSQKTGPQKQPDQSGQKQESGGFFGFGGPKSQTDASKPAESVTGKMFGFGSSFLSSASTLISSTGDELKNTPPVSPKMSPAKDSKSPSIKKPEQDRKPEQPQQAQGPQSQPPKGDKPPPEPSKKVPASPVVSKSGPSTCPLCKLELNVGSKDPPNYSKCTECKNTVCNQCGFNPMPNVKEVQEWLCLNCQMQRALGASEPPGTPLMKLQASPNKANVPASTAKKETSPPEKSPMKSSIPTPAESKTNQASPSGSPQRKPQASQPAAKTEAPKGPESQKQASPAAAQKGSQQDQKTAPQKPPNQTNQQGPKKSSITSTQEESGGFFGFGGPKPHPDVAKPAESLGGKMFGFGSSLFSSASTAINTAVQGETKTTPPVSPKMPAASATKSPSVPKIEKENKVNQVQEPKPSLLSQTKVEKGPPEPKKDAGTFPTIPKEGPAACPLCKTNLNFGSKEPPNYNKCTECKNTVCNQCGFNPMPNVTEVKEWLCLNCQMQRALSASELTAPPAKSQTGANKIPPTAAQQKTTAPGQEALKKETLKSDHPPKTETPVPDTSLKKGGSTTGSPQKTQTTSVTPTTKPARGPDSQTQASPAPGQKTEEITGTSGPQKQTDQAGQPGQSKVTSKAPETGKQPSPKTGPDASKTTESIGGKMFGFGSSIFSSASTLISSAVQDESRTTPPGSRKMSAPPQVSPKLSASPKISPKSTPTASPKMSPARQLKTQMPEEEKKKDESNQSKDNKAQPEVPKTTTASKMAPDAGKTSCPLCKVELNIGSKLPPNYNTCTECKTTVCNQCGFNPMPVGEVKEWLCLTCQMKRAVAAPEPPTLKSQISPKKVPTPAAVQLTDSKPAAAQVKESPAVEKKPSEPVLTQRKQSTASVKSNKSEASAPLQNQASTKPVQEKQKAAPEKPPDNANQPGRKLSNATAAAQQESGGFFGFGSSKTQPDAEKPTEKVTGKMFGFGSSLFSSASTLITSAVQDQPKTTPPVSPKLSPAKDSKTPVKKAEQEKKPEQPQQAKDPPPAKQSATEMKTSASGKVEQEKKTESPQLPKTGQEKVDKALSEPLKAPEVANRPDQSACPLCKVQLNIGSKDQPNYNTCTECKNTVCNQCGFNPMPNETKVKEWLCLTCQMQRALGETQPKGVTSVTPAKPQSREPSPAEAAKKQPSAPQSPQRKLSATPQPVTSEAADKPAVKKQASPVSPKKMPQEPQKSAPPDKSPVQTKQAERKQSNAATVTQKDSGGFFGFGSGKTQPETEKPAESVTGKMFGFGSSIFSSASTLITSTVQDQPKTTPPVSPKMTPAKEVKSPAAQVKSKPEQPQEEKAPPLGQTDKDKAPSKPQKAGETSHAPARPGQSTCPLCKVEMNVGSKDPPNYNTCTECKNTVCNQCGFTPMPNESEMKEWLCLTCQMQRAIKATESIQPPLMKPQASPSKVSTTASTEKDAAASQKKDTEKVEASRKNEDKPTPEATQKKLDVREDTTPTPKLVKDNQAAISAPKKEEKVPAPGPKGVAAATAPPSKEIVTADIKPPQSAPAAPDSTKPKDSAKLVSEIKEQKDGKVEKPVDKVRKSSDGQPQQAPMKISEPDEPSAPKNASPAAEKTNQESEGFFGFGSPKSQRAASKATEAVTGKVLGFGSSLFSSASTLITSAVQEQSVPSTRKMSAPQVSGRTSELQTSPKSSPPVSPKKPVPGTRKMSAPQVSGKMSELKISPKSSPPVSPKKEKEKDLKPDADQKPQVEKITAQPEQVKTPASEETAGDKRPLQPEKAEAATKVGESTCPLCKVELNMDSKSLTNWSTCTECKTVVCSKCGFSPMPNLTEVKEWLCLNCQMQRALGASEPPGLPMMKLQPSPSREVPVATQKAETSVSTPQQDTFKQDAAKTEPAAVAATKKDDSLVLSTQTKEDAPKDAPLPDKTISSTVTKTDVSPALSKSSTEIAKGQPSVPQQQAPPVQTSSKPAALPDTKKEKSPPQQPPKAEVTPAKSVTPPVQPAKQESGGFFGFGAPKAPPTAAKPAESVTGKMFGFGSSFLSSASTLITSAVQDEPKTTPPTPRKMSAAGSVSPKATPPVSPKITPAKDSKPPVTQKPEALQQPQPAPPAQDKAEKAPSKPLQQPPSPKTQPSKDTKLPAVQKTEGNKAEMAQQEKTPSTPQVDKTPELDKKPAEAQAALKADQSICPLCKIKLNMGSAEPPNYNTCTECKATVCNQCGFNPMPNVSEVKEWLCLNCQVQRALGAAKEPAGPAVAKRQPSPSKVSTPPSSVQEKPKESPEVQKELTKATPPKEQATEAKGPMPTAAQKVVEAPKTETVSAAGKGKPQDVAGPKQPAAKPAQVQDSQTTKTEVKPQAQQDTKPVSQPSKPAPAPSQPVKQNEKPSTQQPPKAGTTPAKSVTPPVQPAKQESGGFFGFGAPKTPPTAVKSAESVKGKMFGFGSSFLTSASTLITSAVQDEPKTTPPTPRKMSTTGSVSPKITPPVSPKMAPAKDTKPPVAQKSEPPQAKPSTPAPGKVEKAPPQPPKPTEAIQSASKAGLSTCPLCKVELNVGSKDPPNYNTCTECKNTVCNLCGFNPMPHTAAKEWLCLNCQTQRALSGQLVDAEKMPQPVSTKPEKTEPKPAPAKAEPTAGATRSQPVAATVEAVPTVPTSKAKVESASVKMEAVATAVPVQIEPIPTTAKVVPVTAGKPSTASTTEPPPNLTAQIVQPETLPKAEAPEIPVQPMEKTEVKKVVAVKEFPTAPDSKPDIQQGEVVENATPSLPLAEAEVVPTSSVAVELEKAATETKQEQPVPEKIVKDDIETKPTQTLQQNQVQPKSQEQQAVKEGEPAVAFDSKELAAKSVKEIPTIASTPVSQPLSKELVTIQDQEEKREDSETKSEVSLPAGQAQLENIAVPLTQLPLKPEELIEDQPQILPISQEVNVEKPSDAPKDDLSVEPSMPLKTEVKTDRRRLSFQPMDESSESEITPSPSPKVQRRRLQVTNVSSSSEDLKTESADSSIEDEDFIRKQILGMGDEEEMSVSDDEKDKKLANVESVKDVTLDNASVTAKSLTKKGSTDNEGSPARNVALAKTDAALTGNIPETMPKTTFKKAIPVLKQRQSTEDDVESITESLSKGSSSVQASSFTPESSHTSASSLEEDSDSSPSHRKVSRDKSHRKGKHKQPAQHLPTIEDSSDEENMRAHSHPLSPTDGDSSPEGLRQVTVIDETHRTSGSDYSASIESEAEAKRAVQRGRKPSPTVIPYTPSDLSKVDTFTKSLKSAEEAYEEIIQKTKSIPGESPPDVEPLYGGMAIEDYLYESLVEEPEIKLSETQLDQPRRDSGSESVKKLRSPEEVYEEMMQKKRELMMIEHEFQQAQTAMDSSSSATAVTGPLSVPETCVVTISSEEIGLTGQTDIPVTTTEASGDVAVKKKKRPAPPRPSEPPKRTEGMGPPFTPSGSIGFVRPMVPQDPALRKALFPIPDLKITQCSSGEEEDDSLADEYGMGMSSDITPSDDSEPKEDPSISPPLSETTEMEPICVVCEIPEPKPIPTPISAPELTTTPSPVSPVSPPTSPATPDSSLASNATSSSSFQAQTSPSSDSTPMSTPTPPTSYKGQSIPEVSSPAISSAAPVSQTIPAAVIVTIPDVVSDPSKAEKPSTVSVNVSTAEAKTQPQKEPSATVPVLVQMPDLVSSPSQVPNIPSAVVQVSSPSPLPSVVSAQPVAPVATSPVSVTTSASVNVISASVALPPCPGPVIVQMPDLVSTAAPISAQTPVQVSALVTTATETQGKVVSSVPVQSAVPSVSPVQAPVQTTQVLPPAPSSTTIVKKKVPPPPPPRSTSVSLPEPTPELPPEKMSQPIALIKDAVAGRTMQSVVVDIQPKMEAMQPDSASVPQVVAQTRQGHVVIIVPSVDKLSQSGQTTQDKVLRSTASPLQGTQITTHPTAAIPSAVVSSPLTAVSSVQVVSAPPMPSKPTVGAKPAHTVEVPVMDPTQFPPSTSPKPTVCPKPSIPSAITTSTEIITPIAVTTTVASQMTKPPPPIPPKPISIPAGLVFSHKPGESVKPPPPPVAPKAATLPRTKEPPNALSLSLTRPVESKLGTTSPKSPLSPRHAKCLQTYVVITLPSEPGSPTEAITVQAPLRRGSIPATKVSGVRTTPSEQKTPTEAFSAQATVRRASVPTVRQPPPTAIAPTAAVEQVTTSDFALNEGQVRKETVQPILPVVDITELSTNQNTSIQLHTVPPPIKKPYVEQQQSITQSIPPPKPETITVPAEPEVVIQPQTTQALPNVQHVSPVHPGGPAEAQVPQAPMQIPSVESGALTEVVTVPLQSEGSLNVQLLDKQPAVHSTVTFPQVETQVEIIQKDHDIATGDTVKEAVQLRSPLPEVTPDVAVQQPIPVFEPATQYKELEASTGYNNTQAISEFSSFTQYVPSLEILPLAREQQSLHQPILLSEVVTLPSNDLATDIIAIDRDILPEEVSVSQALPATAVVAPIPEIAKTMTPSTAEASLDVQQIATYPNVPSTPYIQQVQRPIPSPAMSYSVPPLEATAFRTGYETPSQIATTDIDGKSPMSTSEIQQPLAGMPGVTTEATTSRRRTSISSVIQPPYTSEISAYSSGFEIPTQVVTTEQFATTRRESITMPHSLPSGQVVNMPAERDVSIDGYGVQAPYRRGSIPFTEQQPQVLTYSSEYDHPLEIITTEAYTRRTSIPSVQDIQQGVSVAPVTITKIQQESIESQEIRGPEKVVSSMSHMYSSSISTSGQPPESLPSRVTQVVTTEVQRTTVSVVHERVPQVPPSVGVTIQPDIAKVQPVTKQNGIYPGDVIDLRTMKVGVKMTEQGMDLTPPESCRHSFSSDSSGRQITAVQPEIVNLSAEITPATTLSVVTDSITIVTCTATIASYQNTPAEKPLDLQGPVTSSPLPLTTYKPFEPLAQIVYRPVNTQPKVSAMASTAQDIPINLSFEALVSAERKHPASSAPIIMGTGGHVASLEATGAMDLSNYRPVRAMVALSGSSPGVVTTVVEDDGTPVDLTAGRRSVCCDVIYKLPFTGSCRTQPPVTTQPDNSFGYREGYNQYDDGGIYGTKGTDGLKASLSDTNMTEAGMFSPKNDYDYLSGSSDAAIDLTAAKLSAGKALDYTSKAAGLYPVMTSTPYSQVSAVGFGVNSALRTSDGIVYSSVSAPVPSTYAITTQPGSIFSTTITPTSTVQNQSLAHPYGFIPTTDPGQIIPFDTGLPKELLPSALADIITGYPDMYSDTTLEAIAASLDALASSPIFPGLDNAKMAQYQMEREFLELEKLKQLCLAEELEWERQEIQRYREQEQIMVQRELEELQALKQQLLLQQEEEHHAHMVAQQETYAQQKEQLQQIQQLQLQLQRQLDEHYNTSGSTGNLLDAKYAGVGDSGQYWPVKDESATPTFGTHAEEGQDHLNLVNKLQADHDLGKKIIDSGVQTDDEDSAEKQNVGRRKKSRRNTDSSAQTDDEDQDEWDAPTKARRRSRKHSSEGKHGSKVSSIAIQTVAEISVQTDHSGTIKRPNIQMDTKVEIVKHISAPENSQRGGSLSCQTDSDRRHTPIEVGYSTHLTAEVPSKSKVFYTAVSPLSPEKSHGGQRMLTADPNRFSSGPRILKSGQKSLSDPKSLSPSTDDRMGGYYADSYSSRGSPSGTGKKVKRTLPDPPPEDDSLTGRAGYSTGSARRRLARSTTMARAKILQDIDKELDLVERESSKLRKKQAELDEEEKEIDAKLRYLEMGINRRKEALLKEREKRERAYLQGVAEERDYMSDSEVSNIREARGDGLERPRTAPQSEFDQFIPPQTEADSQYNTLTSPYSHYAQYVPQTQTTSHYTQQNLYQQQSLYHQQVSPYPTLSLTHGQAQPSSYQHALLLQQGKQRQTNLSDLEPKITTNYEVIRNQPLLIVPTSTESGYGVAHLGGKYGSLDLRLGLEERSMASSPMSSISADSFYADIDHHNARNYVLIEDIGELTKASTGLSNTGLGSGFNLPDKELSKADRLLRAAEVRRTAEVAEFLGSSRLQGYGKGEDDTMEEPYELKLLKQQIKQEFRRGTEGLEQLTGLGLPQYIHSDSSLRHFPKGEKYSIGRLTLEKQAAKQLPAAMLYQKQMKNKKALIDPKAITKFSPIQESRDLEPEFGSYMGSGASSVSSLAARARLLQDEITFGLRKNLSEQQKYLGSSLGANLSGSLNLGQSLGLGSTIRASAQDDGTYPSGSRSRPSSRPSSVYGLDLSIKRDLSSSSLRLKTEGDVLDAAFAPGVARTKPTSLPISQSRGRIPIVAQNSEEESPLSPVGQPMGMARASAGPLPPISADSRDQFGSSHSLPEVQQHMREESRTRGYDRDIAFIMDDLQGAMSDSEAGGPNWNIEAYHLRREDTDWFDKPREGHPQSGNVLDRRQMKLVPYAFPHTRIKLKRDVKDSSVSGNGLGIRVVGGKEIPGSRGEIGAYIAKVIPGGVAEQTGKVVEGMQVLEWNGVPLTGKTYEEVQCIMGQPCAEAEICVRLDLNMLSDPEHPQALEHHIQLKAAGGQRSPGVDPKQLAAELQKVSQQQGPGMAGAGVGPGGLGMLSALERSALLHSGTGSAASSGVPSPGQPASPAISKKQRHKPEIMRMPPPISGEIQLQINYDRNLGNLIVHVLQARNLAPRDNDGYSDPFVKVYLLPGRGQVMVVQNASADNKRRTKYAQRTLNPEWNQTVIYKNIHLEQLKKKTLEVTVWDYDRSSANDFLGEVLIDLSNTAQLDNTPRWLPLKEQSESIEHSRAHHGTQGPPGSGQGHGQTHSLGQGHMSVPGQGHGYGQGQAPGLGDGSQDSPKNSVIKSRSHGIFPDPAKDMQMLPLEKSHSSPGSSKSSSDGQLRSHGPSRSQSKSSVTQAHLEDAGIAIAAAEAAVQQSRLQPRPGHRLGDVSGSVVLSAPSLVGDAYGDEGDEGAGTGVDSAIFQVPRIGKAIPNGTDKNQLGGGSDNEGGKTQVMGEIKVALKKEVKTEGDQLVLEILQCRNITYKFKSPDHLPDLYVKLYVVNVATQKRIIKKKTRVCRHDREPSFNETFRFPLNPTGHSIQLFLVSNGGKFVKKTLIGEAYIWLDKVDMRKRVVSWHKLFVSSTQTNP